MLLPESSVPFLFIIPLAPSKSNATKCCILSHSLNLLFQSSSANTCISSYLLFTQTQGVLRLECYILVHRSRQFG
ncbi:hypothetical protein O181_027068 [Austropuccinia psidii MF-1]|uniref:Uncharacterized protein n=1 Tax=Austropuccinia psidii MF-1 TaxID=1389203 RepID=A0A9Q3CNT3_9BASI|nr:hypothetical protein [Austropuccinia psidii MF-1]